MSTPPDQQPQGNIVPTVVAPRPLQLFLEDEGKVLGGPELLVRGRSQADAHGLVVPLPQRSGS